MAEERLIDDDLNKDKKYKIRKNADGEDELYIDDTVQEDLEEFETVSFDVPEFAEGDGELTPDQLAVAEQARREHAEMLKGVLSVNIEKAQAKLLEGDFEGAKEFIDKALNFDPANGTAWSLKLKQLTKNFTLFEQLDDCVEAASNVQNLCTDEQKAELADHSLNLENMVYKLEEQAATMHVEVEQKKAERRVVFLKDRKKSITWFSVACVPFIVCLVVAIAFAATLLDLVNIYGPNLYITIVFGALAVIFFVLSVFTCNKMWNAMKMVTLNEKNSSTELGREYENLLSEIKKLNTVLHSFKK